MIWFGPRGSATLFAATIAALAASACLAGGAAERPARVTKDLAFLRDGVSEVSSSGIPGSLCLLDKRAFAVVMGRVDRRPTPVVAAGRLGKGRVVAFGHEGFFGDHLKMGDTGRFLVNCARWAAAKTDAGSVARVGSRGFGHLEALLKKQGFAVKRLSGRNWTRGLGEVDVVVTSPASLSNAGVKALTGFVENGGGVLAGIPGWGWMQLNPGKSIGDDMPGNRLFAKAGIVWGDGYQRKTSSKGFAVKGEPPRFAHAGLALDALMALAEGRGRKPTKDEMALGVSAISRCVLVAPTDDTLFRPRLNKLLETHSGKVKLPSGRRPLTDADGLAKVILTMQLQRNRRLPPDQLKAHPAAKGFPGPVPADAPRVTRQLKIDTAAPRWHSTGLYAAPGEVVAVTVPKSAARKGLWLRIGAHSDRLWHRSSWKRAPAVARRFPLNQPATKGANAFGGLVYIEVPGRCRLGEVTVEIAGAVEAPLYVHGKTELDDWRARIRKSPGPWAELASDKLVITVPSANVRKLDDPERLMAFWDRVMDACADLAARPRKRPSPERYVSDMQISAGYMHAGYPIMTFLDAAPRFVNHKLLSTKGDWGMFHEMGHNHQHGDWTFGGTGETTCNLFTVYVLETVCRITGGHGGIDPKRRAAKLKAHLAAGADFARWKSDPFLSLAMYLQLKDAFGWDAFKKVIAEYRSPGAAARPKNDEQKRDQWMVRFSKAVGRNLGPFFQAWGVPTSQQARKSIAHLPAWMPDEMAVKTEPTTD